MRRTPTEWATGNPNRLDGNTDFDDWRAVLDFETNHPGVDGRKLELVRTTFNVSAARYYQRLNQIIRTEKAKAAYPQLVRRLIDRIDRGPHHQEKK